MGCRIDQTNEDVFRYFLCKCPKTVHKKLRIYQWNCEWSKTKRHYEMREKWASIVDLLTTSYQQLSTIWIIVAKASEPMVQIDNTGNVQMVCPTVVII